jgi:hypothetical protein
MCVHTIHRDGFRAILEKDPNSLDHIQPRRHSKRCYAVHGMLWRVEREKRDIRVPQEYSENVEPACGHEARVRRVNLVPANPRRVHKLNLNGGRQICAHLSPATAQVMTVLPASSRALMSALASTRVRTCLSSPRIAAWCRRCVAVDFPIRFILCANGGSGQLGPRTTCGV